MHHPLLGTNKTGSFCKAGHTAAKREKGSLYESKLPAGSQGHGNNRPVPSVFRACRTLDALSLAQISVSAKPSFPWAPHCLIFGEADLSTTTDSKAHGAQKATNSYSSGETSSVEPHKTNPARNQPESQMSSSEPTFSPRLGSGQLNRPTACTLLAPRPLVCEGRLALWHHDHDVLPQLECETKGTLSTRLGESLRASFSGLAQKEAKGKLHLLGDPKF